jgi:hypothetical protein
MFLGTELASSPAYFAVSLVWNPCVWPAVFYAAGAEMVVWLETNWLN